jgi:hypothetical protein
MRGLDGEALEDVHRAILQAMKYDDARIVRTHRMRGMSVV